jgi:hypothetical protein
MAAPKRGRQQGPENVKIDDNLRDRLFAPLSEAELARRRRAIEEIRRLRTSIAPMTVVELRRLARLDAAGDDNDCDHGVGS